MKLLTFRLLKLQSERLRFCMCTKPFTSKVKQSKYIYSINELLENVEISTKNVLSSSSCDASNEIRLKDLLNSDSQYRSIVNSVILIEKCGRLGNSIEESNCLQPFFNHLRTSIADMTAEDVVSTLIALNLLNVPLHHSINQELIIRITNMLKGRNDKKKNREPRKVSQKYQ